MKTHRTLVALSLCILFLTLMHVSALAQETDLVVVKSNNVAGSVVLGDSFQWTFIITNDGPNADIDAVFTAGERIFVDDLPAGATYSITQNISTFCAVLAGPKLECTAAGAGLTIPYTTGSETIIIEVTPTASGTLNNPRAAGICRVDPDETQFEFPPNDDDCNSDSVTVTTASNLSATKTNSVNGSLLLGQFFNWTITVANTQSPSAEFASGETILIDSLPNGNTTYGDPEVQNATSMSGSGSIACQIAIQILTCTASGGNVSIGANTGSFDVVFSVTPTTLGTLTNPTGGLCQVDPNDDVTESDESDNDCTDAVVVESLTKLAAPVAVRARVTYHAPFWCGERKDEFTMDGVDFVNLEQYETEIEIVYPQKRILGIFPLPQEMATLIESATIVEPSDFQTPGDMSLPIRNMIEAGKTLRITCADLLTLPTRLDEQGDIDEVLFNLLQDIEHYHGVLSITSSIDDVRVFVTKIIRSSKGIDQGSGLDFVESQLDRDRFEVEGVQSNVVIDVEFEVDQNPLQSQSQSITENLNTVTMRQTLGSIIFRAQASSSQALAVEIFGLNGKRIYADLSQNSRLVWHMRTDSGRPVANGVYLYVVSTRNENGNILRSEVKKLLVMR